MKTEIVDIEKPAEVNLILGQSHFIKTVEDLYETMVSSVPGIKFGLAFCEASGDRLIRYDGTDEEMIGLAKKNAEKIACGHSFIIFMKGAYPINVLNAVKNVQEVCRIFCATANNLQVVVAESKLGRGILGVIDGEPPKGIESEDKIQWRKGLLRKFGYKR
ncbi:adenosine-specific kinase [Candidatus Woesearchaeota archaeon]|nr:adenosine-specific kinase [Candidatus Woesearchaeota archaeon]